MKNYVKALFAAATIFLIAASCENETQDEQTYEQLKKMEQPTDQATDGDEVKRPGSGT
tara:strand:+ start:1334 stop:1507 length:174 start_codon:yes stop_codon:yes gene_type:complete